MIDNFMLVDNYVGSIGWLSLYNGHFWVLVACTLSYWSDGNSYPYCYDNIWADVVLENGRPDSSSIYSIVDLFTWEGWLYLWGVYCVHWFLREAADGLFYIIVGSVYYFMV